MIEAILDKAEIGDRYINDTWYWNYTCSGAEICNVFYNAAIELGYMEKQAEISLFILLRSLYIIV